MVGKERKKKPLSEAQLRQRRDAARLAGRPRMTATLARARKDLAAARLTAMSYHSEIVATLVAGMKGELPHSDAKSMQSAARDLAKVAGLSE